MNPLIAILPDVNGPPKRQLRCSVCETDYTDAVVAAGGIPWIMPVAGRMDWAGEVLDRCDGLLLIGGGDLTRPHYHRELSVTEDATLWGMDEIHDTMELDLIHRALDSHLPLLGVCRGMQTLNVAAGGTLIPDIHTARPDALPHQQQPEQTAPLMHPIAWEPSTRLARLMGADCREVNTSHHQSVDQVAPGFVVAGRAPDGIIEAIELPGNDFVVGVQFHPERLAVKIPAMQRLFDALVTAARRYRG